MDKVKKSEYFKGWYIKNREKIREQRKLKRLNFPTHDRALRIKEREVRETKLAEKAGNPRPDVCEVCGTEGKIFFDHNHRTGKFRGWICHNCNVILGLAKDDTAVLIKLIAYLNKTGSTPIDGSFTPITVQQVLKM